MSHQATPFVRTMQLRTDLVTRLPERRSDETKGVSQTSKRIIRATKGPKLKWKSTPGQINFVAALAIPSEKQDQVSDGKSDVNQGVGQGLADKPGERERDTILMYDRDRHKGGC